MVKYSYGSSRGNKIWVWVSLRRTERSRNFINMAVELNRDNSKSKINWIVNNDSKGTHDMSLDDIRKLGYDNDFVKESLEFANKKGYTRRWWK